MKRLCSVVSGLWVLGAALSTWTRADDATVAFGSTSGHPGDVVSVHVRARVPGPVTSFQIGLRMDTERLELLEYDPSESDASVLNAMGVRWEAVGANEAYFGNFDLVGESGALPPGVDLSLGRLQFRVRSTAPQGEAVVEPVETVELMRPPLESVFIGNGGGRTYGVQGLTAGSVQVLSPLGPRPVDELSCTQSLDRIVVRFRPVEAYDAIEIRRDDALVDTLGGDAVEFQDSYPGRGTFVYSVVARRGDEVSVAISCALTTLAPAPPAIEDLACAGGILTWRNPAEYDTITILRDGGAIAQLPGQTTEYRDPNPSTENVLYTVVGETAGYRSSSIHCFSNEVWIFEVGDVQVPVDAERVTVPIFATTSGLVAGLECCLEVDLDRLDAIEDYALAFRGTSGYPSPDYYALGLSSTCTGAMGTKLLRTGVIYDMLGTDTEKFLPVGIRHHILNLVFEPRAPLIEGEVLPLRIVHSVLTDTNGDNARGTRRIGGEIRVSSAGLLGVQDLQARVTPLLADGGGAAVGSDVALSWRNPSLYDRIRIQRGDEFVAETSGGATGYIDTNVQSGIHIYEVEAVQGDRRSLPVRKPVATFAPPDAFLRGDADRNGRVTITDAIATLNYLFLGGDSLPCEDAADTDDDGVLGLTDPIVTLQYLFVGHESIRAPGTELPWFDPTPDGLDCDE